MSANACVCRGLTAVGKVHCAACGRLLPHRLRSIGPSHTEAQRFRRAEDRDDMPAWPTKAGCPGCVASRAADSENRWPVGDCGPDCLRRAARRASA